MNKNLEKEYRDLVVRETDAIDADALWNRIEASLPPKEVKTDESSNLVDFTAPRKWYKNPRTISIFATTAAACVIGFLLLSNNFLITPGRNSAPTVYTDEAPSAFESNKAAEAAENASEDFSSIADTISTEKSEIARVESASETMGDDMNLVFHIDFRVVSEENHYYLCKCISPTDFLAEGDDFYIVKDQELEADKDLSLDLQYEEIIDEKKVFSIFK